MNSLLNQEFLSVRQRDLNRCAKTNKAVFCADVQ